MFIEVLYCAYPSRTISRLMPRRLSQNFLRYRQIQVALYIENMRTKKKEEEEEEEEEEEDDDDDDEYAGK